MPVFAFEPDDGVLHQLGSEAEALRLEADTSREFLFFAADGSPLKRSGLPDGSSYLRPWAACGSCRLDQVLHAVRVVQTESGVSTIEAVLKHLEEARDE